MAGKAESFGRVAAVALAVFCWLALLVALGQTLLFDLAVRDAVHSWAGSPLTAAMRVVTRLGEPPFLGLLGILVAWRLRAIGQGRAALLLALSALGALAVSETLKLVFHRHRPEAFFGFQEPSTYSFPSGHSMVSLSFYGVLCAIAAERTKSRAARYAEWIAASAMIFLIGFSRVYLGVHYPTDVLGGYAAALVWIVAARKISYLGTL